MDSDKLEQIKENVKPLREGRAITTLMKSALSDDTAAAKTREETRRKYENDLKTLKDDDLFEAYYTYVHWIEQNYPNCGKEANLSKVLEECIQAFYKHEKYRNDERMLTLFLKYVNLVSDALSVFEFFYKVKFARKLALFYISWSYQFEMQNNFKKALNVIKVGMRNEAQPMEDLKRTSNDLEVRTMRFVSTNEEETQNADKRNALFKLKAKKDGHVPAERKENAVKESVGLKVKSENKHNNVAIEVFKGGDNAQASASSEADFKKFIDNRENVTNPDKWSENKLKLKSRSKPVENFEIFVDSNIEPAKETHYPIAQFEDQERLKLYSWYPHIKEIYRDHTEYSFEEIRYQKWLRNQRQQSQAKPNQTSSHAQGEKSLNATSVVRAFFNEPLTTTINDVSQLEKSKSTENFNENFDIENTKNQSIFDTSVCTAKFEELQSCSSSTPHMNKTFNRNQNLRAKSFHNPNFVNGITSKLSTIVELSREEYSKSSSSSSSGTSGTVSCINGPLQKKDFVTTDCINPFDNEYKKRLLASLNETVESRTHFTKVAEDLPSVCNSKHFLLELDKNTISSSEPVYRNKNEEMHYFALNSSLKSEMVKCSYFKICKSPDYWEFYIFDELKRRLIQQKSFGPDIELSIFTVDTIFYNNGSIVFNDIECDYTLKQMIDKSKSKQITFPSTFTLIATLELLIIIKQIHECYIIHSNICLENIIFYIGNSSDVDLLPERTSIIKLLQFSRAIDLKLLPDQSVFSSTKNIPTPIRNLLASMEINSWSYEIDWIGLMNTIHLMVFGCDMKVERINSKWKVEQKFANEYSVLEELFDKLLEAVTTHQKPNINRLILQLTTMVKENKHLNTEIYEFKDHYLL